ncbi:MAG: hypothetical protein JNM48_04190 [Rhodospirillales bacterium]|nr:hypothetical protein [Rhodospirillales bacterium]
MMTTWTTAVETAADTLGDILNSIAEGKGSNPAYEEIAASVLRSGLAVLLEGPPEAIRLDEVGRVLRSKLHDDGDTAWDALPPVEKTFWLDLAAAAIAAGDDALLDEAGAASG